MKIYNYMGKSNISGKRIRQARRAQDFTQEQLAAKMQLEQISIDQRAISQIESEQRFVADYELRAFAKVLKVDTAWLLQESHADSSL